MSIIRKAKNIFSQIEEEYTSVTGGFNEIAEVIIVDSSEENLSLNSNMKIITHNVSDNSSNESSSDNNENEANACEVEDEMVVDADPLIVIEIEGEDEVIIGSKATYRVKELNREVTSSDKQTINWAVEIDNDNTIQLEAKGYEVEIEFKEEWRGFNVRILSYIKDIEDEGYFDVTTIKYFKQNPRKSGLTVQFDPTTCVTTVMAHINNELGGNKTASYYLNYYMNNFLTTMEEKLVFANDSGIDLGNMDAFINGCFNTLPNAFDTKENINNGYPIIFGIKKSIDNGHCLAIIGYTSDRLFKVIDPEQSEEVTGTLFSLLAPYGVFEYYKPIISNK